jgi:Flp pilus assembly protein TadB
MSIGQIIVLAAVVGAFVLFAAVLGWGDYRAQQLVRRIHDRDRKESAMAALKQTGKSAATASGTAQARWPQQPDDRLQRVG